MRTFWAQPLRRQLLLANLLLFLGPVLGLAIWSSIATLRERRDDLRNQAKIVAQTMAAYIDRDLRYLDSVAELLSADPLIQSLDREKSSAMLQQVILGRPSLIGIFITSPDGELAGAVRPDVQLKAPTWNPEPSSPVRRPEPAGPAGDPAHYVVLGYPLKKPDGRRFGTLSLFVDMQRLDDSLKDAPLPPSTLVVVSDTQRRVLAQNLPAGQNAWTVLGKELPDSQPGDLPDLEGTDGLKRMQVRTMASIGPWQVTIGVPHNVALERAAAVWKRTFAVMALGLVGCFIGAWFLSRRLGGSVSHLDAAAQRIAAGDFSPLPMKQMRSAEFADLQTAFNGMLDRFNATRNRLDAQMAEERRIRQELESLQGQVIRQERLAAVGQLVSGVAHEINNPLQAILGFAELLQMQHDVPDSVKSDLRLIQKESARACAIIRNLALFARQQPGEAGPVMMIDVIRSVAELRQRRLESEDIELRIDDRATRAVKAVLTELQQVVLNFVVNAEQAILASGRLPGRITIRAYDSDGRVVLEVEDSGPGIAGENEAKLFQPFFTTKPVGQGTGLGLSISYGIIDSLGGGIGYRGAAAGGAIFYFDLPATLEEAVPLH